MQNSKTENRVFLVQTEIVDPQIFNYGINLKNKGKTPGGIFPLINLNLIENSPNGDCR